MKTIDLLALIGGCDVENGPNSFLENCSFALMFLALEVTGDGGRFGRVLSILVQSLHVKILHFLLVPVLKLFRGTCINKTWFNMFPNKNYLLSKFSQTYNYVF